MEREGNEGGEGGKSSELLCFFETSAPPPCPRPPGSARLYCNNSPSSNHQVKVHETNLHHELPNPFVGLIPAI